MLIFQKLRVKAVQNNIINPPNKPEGFFKSVLQNFMVPIELLLRPLLDSCINRKTWPDKGRKRKVFLEILNMRKRQTILNKNQEQTNVTE